ncbi:MULTISPECIES: GDP-mannose 4,6-dehydratase [unclassified Paenibacillus]|uniref:GDP-mannose 4,6-dehydratase n=1 Tax=unclassified Paenibacillus TaxID=185978 RepID=UPI00095661F4|nr:MULTISPECIES: GDP-mannose 4,6-dehydratase [unclassified Paenibacillus]ASS67332.2 GDP-mannose 4,6-dehydratase [Paenibacillus sp. RUD330]SIQ81090.1 GDP-4-dehydro-6-deoxy-D-mannose reductase [Paenibacillus sp. RU4X]SIR02496.1 GDP-4-dehydro-6-deoxy-D-mannose reductase [Paenibacillus sp. RU4T]
MKALVTGITGFVGNHLLNELLSRKDWKIWGAVRTASFFPISHDSLSLIQLDLHNEEEIIDCINKIKPHYIFHLAGQSNVRLSWDDKKQTFDINTMNALNLLEAIRKSEVSDSVRLLTVGSSEEYGIVKTEHLPINEDTALNPQNPYGISKAAISMLIKQYHKAYGLNVIHVRPFNHIGPGQRRGFVTADFAYQVAAMEAGKIENVFRVGNLSSQRDFLDVRDIVKAYLEIVMHGKGGEIYNVCLGKATSIQEILNFFVSQASLPINVEVSQELFRPVDIPLYVGDNTKLFEATKWKPNFTLQSSLADILHYWRNEMGNEGDSSGQN